MKQTTDKKKSVWLARCRVENCEEERVKCPKCKHAGHVVTHVDTRHKGRVYISIQHSHYVENEDGGRNMYCHLNRVAYALQSERKESWRLTKEGADRIKDEFFS
jgi:hypothetical protein